MLNQTEAEQLAFNFLMTQWDISEDDREWFTILGSRLLTDMWYVVEIGVEGLPDKWIMPVYDTGECEPNYTFTSPIKALDGTVDLVDLPESVAEAIASERSNS